MCVRLTSITFPAIWSSVLISVTREWRYCGLVYKFFLINNIELKCSFVRCQKYHKSWSNGAAELHISVDLITLWHNGCRATSLGRFTLWHNGRRATQLGRFTLWHNGRRAKPGLMHAPGVADIFQSQWRLNPKKNLTANFWKMKALDYSAITNWCMPCEDSENERFTKTELDLSKPLKDERNAWVSSSKWGKT